jgi:hypothetical protein
MEKRFIWVVEIRHRGINNKLIQPLQGYSTLKSAKIAKYAFEKIEKTVKCKIIKYVPDG